MGYGVMHVYSRHDPATELDRIKELIHYRVDGLILLPSPAPREALDFAARKDVPLVIVDRPTPDARFDQVVLATERRCARWRCGSSRRTLAPALRVPLAHPARRIGWRASPTRRGTRRNHLHRVPERRRVPARRARPRTDRPPTAVVVSSSLRRRSCCDSSPSCVACPDELSVVAFDDPNGPPRAPDAVGRASRRWRGGGGVGPSDAAGEPRRRTGVLCRRSRGRVPRFGRGARRRRRANISIR
jgi:hypothetical protein